MLFADIHGIEATKKHLIGGVHKNQVAHAQLFSGIGGSALLPMALAYATYLNCENPSETDACGICSACSKSLKYIHPDIHFVFPVSSTEEVKIKDAQSKAFLTEWRKFLIDDPYGNSKDWAIAFGGENKQLNISKQESRQIIEALSLKAFEGKYKVMLIWMPEFMHQNAANAILKILEEPAENTVFLLVTEDRERLSKTIRSRTQLVRIPPFSNDELRKILEAKYSIESNKANQLVHLADGSLRTALKIYEDADVNLHDMFTNWMRNCFSNNFEELTKDAEKFSSLTKSSQKTFLLYSLEILRESLVASQNEEKLLRMGGDELVFVKKFSSTISLGIIERLSARLSDAHYHLERNASAKMVFMNLSIIFSSSFKNKP